MTVVVAVGTALATPRMALAASEQKTFTSDEIRQVHTSLQRINTALKESMAKKPQKPRAALSRLVVDGFLPALPAVPEGIGDGSDHFGKGDYGVWSDRNGLVGGCGPNNVGEKQTFNILLRNVSDGFCTAYNKEQGLPAAILGNCRKNPDAACKSSGSNDGNDPVDAGKETFCFKTADSINIIYFNTGLDATITCAP